MHKRSVDVIRRCSEDDIRCREQTESRANNLSTDSCQFGGGAVRGLTSPANSGTSPSSAGSPPPGSSAPSRCGRDRRGGRPSAGRGSARGAAKPGAALRRSCGAGGRRMARGARCRPPRRRPSGPCTADAGAGAVFGEEHLLQRHGLEPGEGGGALAQPHEERRHVLGRLDLHQVEVVAPSRTRRRGACRGSPGTRRPGRAARRSARERTLLRRRDEVRRVAHAVRQCGRGVEERRGGHERGNGRRAGGVPPTPPGGRGRVGEQAPTE